MPHRLRSPAPRPALTTAPPAAFAALAACIASAATEPPVVHSVCDLSQEFTFYMDGRFHRQYLADFGRDARNWGTLAKLDLSNANLLVLVGGDPRLPYAAEAIAHVAAFVEDGGTLLLMADGGDPPPPGAAVAARFGAVLATTRAAPPLHGRAELDGAEITFQGGRTLLLDDAWTPLVVDAEDRPVLAEARVGAGHVLVGSRGLFGRKPDASDPINAAWVAPLLRRRAETKPVDPALPHRATVAEQHETIGALTLEYTEGTRRFADAIHEVYLEVRPHLEAITGVDPAPGMIKSLLVLPTGGGGFSSGNRIAIGAWWGGFPERRYPMVELIAHEAGHSWVLPHPEPLWNEPIATYLGIRVGRRLGFAEADETLARQIAKARRLDPDLDRVDPLADDAPRDLVWGKSWYVFEELERRHGPDALARYFRTKRAVVAAKRDGYTMDDCVAVWSLAVGTDLFPWFRALAFDVDRARTDLPAPG